MAERMTRKIEGFDQKKKPVREDFAVDVLVETSDAPPVALDATGLDHSPESPIRHLKSGFWGNRWGWRELILSELLGRNGMSYLSFPLRLQLPICPSICLTSSHFLEPPDIYSSKPSLPAREAPFHNRGSRNRQNYSKLPTMHTPYRSPSKLTESLHPTPRIRNN